MNKTFADLSLGYNDGILLNNQLSNSSYYCKIVGRINELKVTIDKNSECLAHFDIGLQTLNKQYKMTLKSIGVQNLDEGGNCGPGVGIYKQINGKTYNPQLGDYVIAKVNAENNYINELYPTQGKNIDELNNITKNIPFPYCKGTLIGEKKENTTEILNKEVGNIQILFSLIIILLIIIIGILIFKIKKFKKNYQ